MGRAGTSITRSLLPALVACAVLAACGGAAAGGGGQPAVSLAITVHDARGRTHDATLTCRRGSARKTGFLTGSAQTLCSTARGLARFLAGRPEPGRQCTQQYGGPETAVIRGTIGPQRVKRAFARTDGCEIADWNRASPFFRGAA